MNWNPGCSRHPQPNEAEIGNTRGISWSLWNGDRQDGILLHMRHPNLDVYCEVPTCRAGFVCSHCSQERSVPHSLWSQGLWLISSGKRPPPPRHDTGLTDLYLCKSTAGCCRAPHIMLDIYPWATKLSPRFSLGQMEAWTPALSVGSYTYTWTLKHCYPITSFLVWPFKIKSLKNTLCVNSPSSRER